MYDCQACGACCAFSASPDPHAEGEGARCPALLGNLGRAVACGVYEQRPELCRAFEAGGAGCRAARRWLGLEAEAARSHSPPSATNH